MRRCFCGRNAYCVESPSSFVLQARQKLQRGFARAVRGLQNPVDLCGFTLPEPLFGPTTDLNPDCGPQLGMCKHGTWGSQAVCFAPRWGRGGGRFSPGVSIIMRFLFVVDTFLGDAWRFWLQGQGRHFLRTYFSCAGYYRLCVTRHVVRCTRRLRADRSGHRALCLGAPFASTTPRRWPSSSPPSSARLTAWTRARRSC